MEALLAPVDPVRQAFETSKARIGELAKSADGTLSKAKRIQIDKAAQDFEAVFLSQMLAPMFEPLETDSLFGGGSGERMYRGMLVEEYGKALSRNGGVGIAEAVARQLIASQEITP